MTEWRDHRAGGETRCDAVKYFVHQNDNRREK